jgi:sporulation protein YlmC with PRC-barrel domain
MQTGAKRAPGAYTVAVKKSILGAKVINTAQEDLGKIEDLVVDARNSRLAYAILSFGGVLGLGDKHFAIP